METRGGTLDETQDERMDESQREKSEQRPHQTRDEKAEQQPRVKLSESMERRAAARVFRVAVTLAELRSNPTRPSERLQRDRSSAESESRQRRLGPIARAPRELRLCGSLLLSPRVRPRIPVSAAR